MRTNEEIVNIKKKKKKNNKMISRVKKGWLYKLISQKGIFLFGYNRLLMFAIAYNLNNWWYAVLQLMNFTMCCHGLVMARFVWLEDRLLLGVESF